MTPSTKRRRWAFGANAVRRLVAAALVMAAVIPTATWVSAQGLAGCTPDSDDQRVDLGTPNPEGTTQTGTLSSPTETIGFHFTVKEPSAASLYIGDQWFDINLYLYARGQCPVGSKDRLIRAWSARAEQRVIQFMRPNEQIVNLGAGDYVMLATYKTDTPGGGPPFDPSRSFTARVALNPPYCAVSPPDEMVPNPALPAVPIPRRPEDALYQLGLTISPVESERVAFSLLTFGAFLSPPYTDLFDFNWVLDGRPVPDATIATYQIPTEGLTKTPGGQHTVRLTAVGARPYPDPGMPSIPPTLTVECSFKTLL